MKLLLKKFNLILILALFSTLVFFTGVESLATVTSDEPSAPSSSLTKPIDQNQLKTLDSIPEKNAYKLSHIKPLGFKYSLFKFFIAIIGVLISALAIFGGLKLYQKIILKNSSRVHSIDYGKTLDSPKDFKEAINLFLNKTDK